MYMQTSPFVHFMGLAPRAKSMKAPLTKTLMAKHRLVKAQAGKSRPMKVKTAKVKPTKTPISNAQPVKNLSKKKAAMGKSPLRQCFGDLLQPNGTHQTERSVKMFKTSDGQSFPVSFSVISQPPRVTKMFKTADGQSFPASFPASFKE